MAFTTPTYVASGNILPARFVSQGGVPFSAVQALANAQTLGVAQPGTFYAPGQFEYYNPSGTNYAAINGQSFRVFVPGDETLLEINGTISAGQWLKSDASGYGVQATGSTDWVGARALENGSALQRIRVIVQQPFRGVA